ncbi:Membrane-bound lytic murein transglycosylase D precursor [Bacteroidales bacterium Barb6XT]|nr:Membrane-bound lytic murein transglycosylase D precursor [Bacteroidales bacterium Barb6XT]
MSKTKSRNNYIKKVAKYFMICCLCLSGTALQAQEETQEEGEIWDEIAVIDSVLTNAGFGRTGRVASSDIDAGVDSLLQAWFTRYFAKTDDFCHDDETNVDYPDSVYRQRLDKLQEIIPMTYNETILRYINFYAERRRSVVRYMLGMADYYFPLVEPILEKYGLPFELKYLPIVESAMNPLALSRVGASGFWQFMLPTGKIYGLEINSLVDERRDPVKSTEAACRYFKDMYDIYGDWHLALASFNCGPGGVNKAIRRAKGKKNFWAVYPYLPRETRTYVPLFIAACYIMNYHCEHNICPIQTSLPLATDTIMVNKMLHFEQITDLMHIDIGLLRLLNPQYKRDIIPGHIKPSVLKLPAADTYAFADMEDTVYAHRTDELLAGSIPLNIIEADRTAVKEKITHTTKSGENLYVVGDRYGVTAKEIRRWNNLKSNRVPSGKRLTLYVNNGGISFTPQTSPITITASTTVGTSPVSPKTSEQKSPAKTTQTITYIVQSGDSLYSISKKYAGLSAITIQKANNLSGTTLRPGQALKIPVV